MEPMKDLHLSTELKSCGLRYRVWALACRGLPIRLMSYIVTFVPGLSLPHDGRVSFRTPSRDLMTYTGCHSTVGPLRYPRAMDTGVPSDDPGGASSHEMTRCPGVTWPLHNHTCASSSPAPASQPPRLQSRAVSSWDRVFSLTGGLSTHVFYSKL